MRRKREAPTAAAPAAAAAAAPSPRKRAKAVDAPSGKAVDARKGARVEVPRLKVAQPSDSPRGRRALAVNVPRRNVAQAAAATSPHADDSPRRSPRIRRSAAPADAVAAAAAHDVQLICRVAQVSGVVPRKRFDIEVMRAAVVLRGKSVSLRVPCAAIARLIILPIPRCGVVDVAVEMRAGCEGVRGRHLVLRAPANLQVEWQGNGHPPDKAQAEADVQRADAEAGAGASTGAEADADAEDDDSGSDSDDDTEPAQLLADALASACGAAVVSPGPFRSALGHHAVGCTLSVEQGYLYLLDDAALFVHHPVLAVRYADVASVRCAAVSGLRMIQLAMRLADGDTVVFDHVDKSEHEFLTKFLVARGLRFEDGDDSDSDAGEGGTGAAALQADLPDVDDSSDYCPSE